MSWSQWAAEEVASIRAAGRWRQVRTYDFDGDGAGDRLVSFASNDYLGLTRHPSVVAAAHEALDRWGAGAGASRLVVGSRAVHDELESALAAWKGTDAALLFPTGYAANVGVLTTFGATGTRVLSDELNHASIVDGCRMARAEVAVYRHNDMAHLASLLRDGRRSIVVGDTVFSMDGDEADVEGLVDLCRQHDALLVLDEAHEVFGRAVPLFDNVLRVGTLSKMLGSLGGFVAGPRSLVELLVNRARPSIFSTALPPAVAAAALAALEVVQSGEGAALKSRLRALVDRVAGPQHPSPIVPVLLGSEEAALAASAALLERGLVVPAIRPPTVPVGTSRLRVALSATHTDDEVARLQEALCVSC